MHQPTITNKQQDILQLLYRYRFLKQKQIQQFLDHKDKRRSTRWLKDLKNKQYINWFYDSDIRTEPAIYFLDTSGIRWLRDNSNHPEGELRKRYKDSGRQSDFIARCLLLADCALHLDARNSNSDDPVHYDYAVDSDYLDPESDYAFLAASEYARPGLTFTKSEKTDGEVARQTYFVELFDITTPRYMIKKKVKNYVKYMQSNEWEKTKRDEDLPIILIACPTLHEMINAKRYAKNQLDEAYGDAIA